MSRRPRLLRLGLLAGALAGVACEAPLDPIEASDIVFSMSGYLDASADTQWVRVEPFGRTTTPVEGPIPAQVFLEHPDGQRTPMTQRLRTFTSGPAHLFWTTADVAPGQTYRLVARDPGGTEAVATVRVPNDQVVTITLVDGIINCPTLVSVAGAERLADVEARYTLQGTGRVGEQFRFTKLPSLDRATDGSITAQIFFGEDAEAMEINGLPGAYPVRTEVTVALGTDDWPDIEGLTLEDALRTASVGRIENGVGFVGGTVTKTVPFVPGFGLIPRIGDGRDPLPCVR